jgi:hypothetical protein
LEIEVGGMNRPDFGRGNTRFPDDSFGKKRPSNDMLTFFKMSLMLNSSSLSPLASAACLLITPGGHEGKLQHRRSHLSDGRDGGL